MHFVAIIIALLVETYYKPITQWRNYQWYLDYTNWLKEKLSSYKFHDGPAGVVLELGILVFVGWALVSAMVGLSVFLGFLLAAVALLYCIGPNDLDEDVQAYIESVEHDDHTGSLYYAERIVGYEINGESQKVMHEVKRAIFLQANNRMLSVLFWFIVMGPIGAMMFRLCDVKNSQLRDEQSGYAGAYQRLFDILSWIPSRLAVLGYAVVGNFVDTMSRWHSLDDIWMAKNDDFVINSALGALQHEDVVIVEKTDETESGETETQPVQQLPEQEPADIAAAMALVKRMIVFWIAVLGVLTLTGALFA